MIEKKTDPIHTDSETEPQLEGGVDKGLLSLPLAILVKIQKYNGTSLPKCLITEDIIQEVFRETVGADYHLSNIDILNVREFLIKMDPPCTYSLAAMKLQKLLMWLGIEVQVNCTMADSGLLYEIHYQREEIEPKSKVSPEGSGPQAMTSMGGHSNNLLEQMVDRVMGHMMKEVRRLESMIQQKSDVPSILSVCNQPDATERLVGPERVNLMNRYPRLITFSGSENPQKGEHTFVQWLHHFKVSEPSYPENLMREAIVESLHGNAYESIRGLGPMAPVCKIVETLKKVSEQDQSRPCYARVL